MSCSIWRESVFIRSKIGFDISSSWKTGEGNIHLRFPIRKMTMTLQICLVATIVCAFLLPGLDALTYDCVPDNTITVSGFPANTNFFAKQGSDDCTVTGPGTSVSITGCDKDEEVLLTYGSYSDMGTYQIHAGQSVNAVKITCSEIPATGNIDSISNAFTANLTIDESQSLNPTYDVTSTLSSTSVNVGDEVTWTISFPVEYILEVTECKAYAGTDNTSPDNIVLISSGGCLVSSELTSSFTDGGMGSATSTIQAFKFYNSNQVFLECDVKICPAGSSSCDTTCSKAKRSLEIFKRSADQKSDKLEEIYPGKIHNILTITDPYANAAVTGIPTGLGVVLVAMTTILRWI